MESIEERAYSRYAKGCYWRDCETCLYRPDCSDVDYVWAFIDGAQSEHAELTKWHDPKEPPNHTNHILLKLKDRHFENIFYSVGTFYDGVFNHQFQSQYADIIGWRDIHE